jgi:hypothetical protein
MAAIAEALCYERGRERNAEDKKVVERDSEVLLRGPTWLLPTWKLKKIAPLTLLGKFLFCHEKSWFPLLAIKNFEVT